MLGCASSMQPWSFLSLVTILGCYVPAVTTLCCEHHYLLCDVHYCATDVATLTIKLIIKLIIV